MKQKIRKSKEIPISKRSDQYFDPKKYMDIRPDMRVIH